MTAPATAPSPAPDVDAPAWARLSADARRLLSGLPASADRDHVLDVLARFPAAPARHGGTPGHLTVSAVLVDPDAGRMLLTLHPKFGQWQQLGGHLEPTDASLAAAALREAREESGLSALDLDPTPLGVGVFHDIPCPPGQRRQHLDVRFLLRVTGGQEPACSAESLALRWWPLDGLPEPTDDAVRLLAAQAAARLGRN